MATDPYAAYMRTPGSFGRQGRVVTPGANDLDPVPKAVTCLSAGNLTVVPFGNADADTLSYVGVQAGFTPPFIVRRVTAATAIVATVED